MLINVMLRKKTCSSNDKR